MVWEGAALLHIGDNTWECMPVVGVRSCYVVGFEYKWP